LARELNTEVVDAAFAVGVDDVLVLPQTTDQLSFAIHKARQGGRAGGREGSEGSKGRVVTVFSPKGGTGKTVLSTNLASALAAKSEQRVLLIDLDLQFGDAAIMLGVDPTRTLYDLVTAPGELDQGKLEGYVTPHKCGLHILAAPLRPEEAELVTEAKVTELLEVARAAYDVVIVDTSPFFYGPMLALLEPTDQLFMLCGLDVPTLKNVKLSLETLEQLGFPMSRVELVLNRVAPKVGLSREDVEATLGMSVLHEIPNDAVVAPAVNRGAAAVLLEPDSEFASAIASLAASADPVGSTNASILATTSKRRWLTPARRLLEGRSS
jgi:pilus assembly protein CpaE